MYFGGDMNTAAVFCKSEPSPCIFPFIYKDVEYTECTDVDTTVATSDASSNGETTTNFKWCATLTDEAGYMVESFWGKCTDPETCLEKEEEEEEEEAAPEGMGEFKNNKQLDSSSFSKYLLALSFFQLPK